MLDKGLLGPERDGPFFICGRERVAREEEGHFVRGNEVRDVGEDAREGEVVCPGESDECIRCGLRLFAGPELSHSRWPGS